MGGRIFFFQQRLRSPCREDCPFTRLILVDHGKPKSVLRVESGGHCRAILLIVLQTLIQNISIIIWFDLLRTACIKPALYSDL